MSVFDVYRSLTKGLALLAGSHRKTPCTRRGRNRTLVVEALEPRLALSAAPLVITEIMYNPAAPTAAEEAAGHTDNDDFEFLELQNIGTQDLALQGFTLGDGVGFTFPAMTLAPGEYVVVVNDAAAFTARYGTAGIRLGGEYSDVLGNSADRLILKDAAGQTLFDFRYDDAWYPATDGQGASLLIVDPTSAPSTWGGPASWFPSAPNGGSPGRMNDASDLTPPTVPQNMRLTGVDGSQVSLQWDAATDAESGVALYRVYRDGTLIGQSATPVLVDATVQHATTYQYEVAAVNGDGAESAKGSALPVYVPLAATAPQFAAGVSQGTVTNNNISEASGLAVSRRNAGVLWTHNDSAGVATLYALSNEGDYLGAFALAGIQATDCEDIAIGPGPVAGGDYVYLGDIGDNNSDRASIKVYRVAEPVVQADGGNQSRPLAGAEVITLQYPDGAHDAETLLCDPWTGDLYVVTKELTPNRVYRAAAGDLVAGQTVTLTLAGTISFADVNGGDISPNGREILLRDEDAARLYTRAEGQSVMAALMNPPQTVPIIGRPTEPNGEAIAFDTAGAGYFTLSEGADQPLYYFRRTSAPLGNTRTWIGGSGDNWTTAQNWLNGAPPQPGDTLIFSGAATTVNDFPAGTYFREIHIQGGNVAISGNPLALLSNGGMTITVAAGATCSMNIPLLGPGALQLTGGGTLAIQSPGSYTGGTFVHSGTLVVARADALPVGGNLTIDDGGKVKVNGQGTVVLNYLAISLGGAAAVLPADRGPTTTTATVAEVNQPPADLGSPNVNNGTVATAKTEPPHLLSAKTESTPDSKPRVAKTTHVRPNADQAVARDLVLTTEVGKWRPNELHWLPVIEQYLAGHVARTRHDVLPSLCDEWLMKRWD